MCIHNILIVPEFHFPMGGHDLRVMQAGFDYKGRTVKERAKLLFQAPPPEKQNLLWYIHSIFYCVDGIGQYLYTAYC